MKRDKDQLLGHAEDNDGIQEYDNALPDWWLGLFLFTVVWGIGYAVDYHLVSHRSQVKYYEAEMAAAQVQWPQNVKKEIVYDAATVEAGKEIFTANCVACHGADMKGGIGPNLLDATWIHGGEPEDIRKVITDGVPEKGMVTWGPVLGPDKIAKVTAYVVTRNRDAAGTPDGATAPEVAAAGTAPAGDAAALSGEAIFTQNCVACHGADMKGLIGPNLLDAEWIHGGTLADITRTITEGVPEKGMVSWGPILGEEKIKAVASFVFEKSGQSAQQ
ncbi:MAG: c-type cytochrome [Myxococcota bacterium]